MNITKEKLAPKSISCFPKKVLLHAGFLMLLFLNSSETFAQSRFKKIIWSDEFNYKGAPNSKKWGYDTATGCPNNCGWGNQEKEYYTSRTENVIVENGVLKITAAKEDYRGSEYTSTRMHSKNKFSFKYGRVEARAKLPAGIGTWPAIWMLGNNIDKKGWPKCGEIDIMEHRGSELNKIFGTLHYPGRSGGNADGGTRTISDVSTGFHLYSLEWTSSFLKIYVDDLLVHTVANTAGTSFNQGFFLIFNMAMGGHFAGPIDPAFSRASMEVDYIRVYQ